MPPNEAKAHVRLPCVLVLAGLDPGGGAGLLADARAIAAAGAFACAVATVLTIQSTCGLRRTVAVSSKLWLAQARVVVEDQRVGAIKIGALGSASNVRAAAQFLGAHRDLPAVFDPVIVPTRGQARLLAASALAVARRELVPRATLVTANAPEAEALTQARVTTVAEARIAARAIVAMGARAALVKGGHLGGDRAVDVLVTSKGAVEIAAPRLRLRRKTHGTGCTFASLIAARLTLGDDVITAVRVAKRIHHTALARTCDVGGDLTVLF